MSEARHIHTPSKERQSPSNSSNFRTEVLSSNSKAQSNNPLDYKKGLMRSFKVSRDLHKYSATLNYKDTERKIGRFTKSATGHKIGHLVERAKFIQKKTKFIEERFRLKKMDWLNVRVFTFFEEA
jgi:hypothetical protein